MTKWTVAALVTAATLVPALTVAVVLADLSPESRSALADAVRSQTVVLAAGLVVLVGLIGGIAWWTWRSEQRLDLAMAADIDVIASINADHRLGGTTAVARAVNALAERHATAERRSADLIDAAHEELRRERDALLAVLSGLDVPVGVVDGHGRVLLVNPAARRVLGARRPVAAGRSIFAVFAADRFMPLLAAALGGDRPAARVADTAIRLVRITGPDEPAMVLIVGEAPAAALTSDTSTAPVVALSADLTRPVRRMPPREEWPRTPLDEIVFTVLDCETTGLHVGGGDRLVSVAAVRIDGGVVRADDTFDALINPGRAIPAESTVFHGITDDLVADAPPAPDVVADFAAYAADSVLVGHHLAFDLGFLEPPADEAGIALEPLTLDTMLLSALLFTETEARHGLDALCARLGIEVLGRHTALGDALATAEALVRMIPMLTARGIGTLEQARGAAGSTDLAKRMRAGG